MASFSSGLTRGGRGARGLVFLLCLVVADRAARGSTRRPMMSGNVAGHSAHDRTFGAAFGLRDGRCEAQCRGERAWGREIRGESREYLFQLTLLFLLTKGNTESRNRSKATLSVMAG
ncbi:hypothetical protein HDG35_006112 [Paraburkholderia sp. JPY681]|nr:hypothetical protein [Paraburkholderia atlantica]